MYVTQLGAEFASQRFRPDGWAGTHVHAIAAAATFAAAIFVAADAVATAVAPATRFISALFLMRSFSHVARWRFITEEAALQPLF